MGERRVKTGLFSILILLLYFCTSTNSTDTNPGSSRQRNPRSQESRCKGGDNECEKPPESFNNILTPTSDEKSLVKYTDKTSHKIRHDLDNLIYYFNSHLNGDGEDILGSSEKQSPYKSLVSPIDSNFLLPERDRRNPARLLSDAYIRPTRLKRASDQNQDKNAIILEASYSDLQFLDGSDTGRRSRRRVAENQNKEGTPSISESNRFVRGRKHSGGGPNIDSIIQGIMKLLGGNVKLTATEPDDDKLITLGNAVTKHPVTSRINNRGPPRLPVVPFGILPPGSPIRPPVTPPTEKDKLDPNRPQFVANTRPPFLVPLPPALSARPTPTRTSVTGIPIPEDVLASISGVSEDHETETDIEPITAMDAPVVEATEEVNTTDDLNAEEGSASGDEDMQLTDDTSQESSTNAPSLNTSIESSLSSSTTTSITSSSEVELSSSKSTYLTAPVDFQGFEDNINTTPDLLASTDAVHPNDVLSVPTKGVTSQAVTPPLPSKSPQIPSSFQPVKTMEPISSPTRISHSSRTPSTHTFDEGTFPTRLPSPIRPFATTGHRGIVLADTVAPTEYGGQLITAVPNGRPFGQDPEVFDVTVSALQGYGSPPKPPPSRYTPIRSDPLITSAKRPGDGSVYIDGRKTYFNLHPPATNQVQPSGVGTVIPEAVIPPVRVPEKPPMPSFSGNNFKRPQRPPVAPPTLGPPNRIDTCIVGYDTTCKEELGEVCRTEGDVSSCYCKPGTGRKRSRTKCKKSVLLHLSLKVDRVRQRRIVWGDNYANPEAKEYQILVYEAEKALDSAFSKSGTMSKLYMESDVNAFYSLGGRVIVNSTVKLLYTPQTASPNIRKNLQRHLIRVIKTNNNYVGDSALSVEGPLNPVPDVSDVNECFDSSLYDCHRESICTNTFGTYTCVCKKGFTDRYPDDPNKSGRYCDSCSRDFCTKRGDCRIEDGKNVCICEESFYGSRCEIDGEVIAVAVGASVAAVVIIILTLIFLCMWSQRWKAEDRKTEILSRLPGGWFGGWRSRGGGRDSFSVDIHQKGGSPNTYGVTMEDRIRWAQIADTLTHQQNVYSPSTSAVSPEAAGTLLTSALLRLKALQEGGEEKEGVVADVLRLFRRRGQKPQNPLQQLSPEEALTFHQILALQAQLNIQNQAENMRSQFNQERKVMPPPNDYPSLGTLPNFPQQFGMHHLGPPFLPQMHPARPHSTYGQFGPPSINSVPSVGGISRAPTLGARTPLPLRDALGQATMLGPLGGGVATKNESVGALLTESSEEDQDRPYHLPRPKSRSSALDNDDFYYDPDDMMTSQSRLPPLPSSPPPPLPFHFDQFFKSKFP